MNVPVGTILLDKYRVDRVLGQGGMGVVLAATHLHLHERVAMKFLLPEVVANPEIVARFMREAQAAVRLRGEHVARVIDVGTLPWGAPYMVMEYLDGNDLAALLTQRGALPPALAIDYVLQACEGLAEAHGLGIIHRDIKPANFFLTRRPDGSALVKVLDFGISKAPVTVDGGLTHTNAVLGTPAYMSPEQMRSTRDVDARADIWAFGVVLYECLTGVRPFEAPTFSALCLKVAMEPPAPWPIAVPTGLDAIVARCLAKDPAARFRTIAELAIALAPYAGDKRAASVVVERVTAMVGVTTAPPAIDHVAALSKPSAPTPTTLGMSARPIDTARRGSRAWMTGGLAAVAVVGIAGTWALRGGGDDRGRSTGPSSSAPIARPATPAPAPAPPAIVAPAPTPPAPTPSAPTAPAPPPPAPAPPSATAHHPRKPAVKPSPTAPKPATPAIKPPASTNPLDGRT